MLEAADQLVARLVAGNGAMPARLRVHVDARDGMKPGAKYYDWELRGVPLRLEIGPRDLDQNQGVLVRRDTREKRAVSLDTLGEEVNETAAARSRARCWRRRANGVRPTASASGSTTTRFREIMAGDGAFVYAGWCGDAGVRGADQGGDEGHHPRAARRGVPFGGGADHLPEVRWSGHRRGAMGARRTESGVPPRRCDGTLHCEGVPLARIADAVGTPAFVYSVGGRPRSQFERAHHRAPSACRTACTTA